MKKEEAKRKANIENISKEIEAKKKIPNEVKEKVNSKIFENVIFGIIMLIYLGALNLGAGNIPTENYLVDLKVFGILLLILTIILFEFAYKKDKTSLWLHGVEVMLGAIFTIYLIYLYSMYNKTLGSIINTVAIAYLLYYGVKILIERRNTIKNYNKSLGDIGEIVKR